MALGRCARAFGGNLLGGARLTAVQPWVLATVAGLLLHTLSHDAIGPTAPSTGGRIIDMLAGWAGLLLATVGAEEGGWTERFPTGLRACGIVVLALLIAARSFWPRRHAPEAGHDHPH